MPAHPASDVASKPEEGLKITLLVFKETSNVPQTYNGFIGWLVRGSVIPVRATLALILPISLGITYGARLGPIMLEQNQIPNSALVLVQMPLLPWISRSPPSTE